MNKQKTFFAFLESLKSESNKSIIESIKAGYNLMEGYGEESGDRYFDAYSDDGEYDDGEYDEQPSYDRSPDESPEEYGEFEKMQRYDDASILAIIKNARATLEQYPNASKNVRRSLDNATSIAKVRGLIESGSIEDQFSFGNDNDDDRGDVAVDEIENVSDEDLYGDDDGDLSSKSRRDHSINHVKDPDKADKIYRALLAAYKRGDISRYTFERVTGDDIYSTIKRNSYMNEVDLLSDDDIAFDKAMEEEEWNGGKLLGKGGRQRIEAEQRAKNEKDDADEAEEAFNEQKRYREIGY